MIRWACFAFFCALETFGTMAYAERPVTREEFNYDPSKGYIVVWVGPLKGHKGPRDYLDMIRLDPETGETLVEDKGELKTTNARARKDSAAIYNEARPWAIKDDKGLFVIPVNPGQWVIAGVNFTALSLGSYGFSVTPGSLTYVGTVLIGQEDGASDIPEINARALPNNGGDPVKASKALSTIVLRRAERADLPAYFPYEHLTIASIKRDVRFNNYLAGSVSRAADLDLMDHAAPVRKAETYSYPKTP